MRWCPFILNLLVLLTLSMEQCFWDGVAVAKDASHLVCVLDDDETEQKQSLPHENAFSDCDAPAMPDWHEVIRLAHADQVVPLEGAENWEIHTGVRRHRRLCVERC